MGCHAEQIRVVAAARKPATVYELAEVLRGLGYTKGEARALAFGGWVDLLRFQERRRQQNRTVKATNSAGLAL
jgi:hypothetical protein